MLITIAAPGHDLTDEQTDSIRGDLAKVERRLGSPADDEAHMRVRINEGPPNAPWRVVLEVDHRRTHLTATADDSDLGRAVRDAREDVLRQLNDRSPRGHSSHTKH